MLCSFLYFLRLEEAKPFNVGLPVNLEVKTGYMVRKTSHCNNKAANFNLDPFNSHRDIRFMCVCVCVAVCVLLSKLKCELGLCDSGKISNYDFSDGYCDLICNLIM